MGTFRAFPHVASKERNETEWKVRNILQTSSLESEFSSDITCQSRAWNLVSRMYSSTVSLLVINTYVEILIIQRTWINCAFRKEFVAMNAYYFIIPVEILKVPLTRRNCFRRKLSETAASLPPHEFYLSNLRDFKVQE